MVYNNNVFGDALWIETSKESASPVFTKKFTLHSPADKIVLNITGLGWFEAKVNGNLLCDDKFIPVASDYFRRSLKKIQYPVFDTFTHRIYYHVFDITKFVSAGENTLEIQCGGGFFVQNDRQAEGELGYAEKCRCIFAIDAGDEKIFSDGTETWRESNIRYSSLFFGETVDFNFKDEEDKNVCTLPSPDTNLTPSDGTPDRVIRTIIPKAIKLDSNGGIYDVGENISGVVSVVVSAPKGKKYTLRFSECLDDSGNLDYKSTGSAYVNPHGKRQIMEDEFITDGKGDTFMPKFVWHAFRYFEIVGETQYIDDLKVCVIHSDTPVTAEFESDSEGLNFLFDAYIRTQLDNFHCSYPSDCPHRERIGYTGDGQICAQTAMMMMDSMSFYRKWIRDIMDSQDIYTGHVQHTAPFQGGGGGPGGWGSAIAVVPYAYYRQYGDKSILEKAISATERYIDFSESCMENGLVVRELEGGWCLGDWCMLEDAKIPESYVNTCWLVHTIRLYNKMRVIVGLKHDEAKQALEEKCLKALTKQYEEIKHIGNAMLYAAWVGIDSFDRCAKFYDKLGHFDTGFLGTDILCNMLFEKGYGEVAGKLLSSDDFGSFLYMKRKGATTIWETWDGEHSHNHPMFGACARQIFQGVLGIRQPEDSAGFAKVIVSPCLPSHMNYAKGSILTPKGRIFVSLKRVEDGVEATVDAPCDIELNLDDKNGIKYI